MKSKQTANTVICLFVLVFFITNSAFNRSQALTGPTKPESLARRATLIWISLTVFLCLVPVLRSNVLLSSLISNLNTRTYLAKLPGSYFVTVKRILREYLSDINGPQSSTCRLNKLEPAAFKIYSIPLSR